ncbi:MAG: hypothetical protein R3A11_04810 [Bdellovibrionota bacterium]
MNIKEDLNSYFRNMRINIDSKDFLRKHKNSKNELIQKITSTKKENIKKSEETFYHEICRRHHLNNRSQSILSTYRKNLDSLNNLVINSIYDNFNHKLLNLAKDEIHLILSKTRHKETREKIWSEIYDNNSELVSKISTSMKMLLRLRNSYSKTLEYNSYIEMRSQNLLKMGSKSILEKIQTLHKNKFELLNKKSSYYSTFFKEKFDDLIDRRHTCYYLQKFRNSFEKKQAPINMSGLLNYLSIYLNRYFSEEFSINANPNRITIQTDFGSKINLIGTCQAFTTVGVEALKEGTQATVYLPKEYFSKELSLINIRTIAHEIGHALSFIYLPTNSTDHPTIILYKGLFEIHSQLFESHFFSFLLKEHERNRHSMEVFKILEDIDDIRQLELSYLDGFVHSNKCDLDNPIDSFLHEIKTELSPGTKILNLLTFSHIIFGEYDAVYWVYSFGKELSNKILLNWDEKNMGAIFKNSFEKEMTRFIQSSVEIDLADSPS